MNRPALVAPALGALALVSGARAQDTLYTLSDYIGPQLQTIDPATGATLTSVPVTGHESLFGGLAADDEGDLYSIDGYNDPNPDRTFRIDSATGAGTVVGPTGFNWNFRTVCFNPVTDKLFGATDNRLYTIDTGTGAAEFVANITAPAGAGLDQLTALAINAQGQAFFTDIGDTTLFSLDLGTGQATRIGDIGGSSNWFDDLAFDSAGVLWGARAINGGMYTIDTASATETFRFFGFYRGLVFVGESCYADCDASGSLNVNDYICFQTRFALGDPYADCDANGVRNVNDYICFQTKFALGCS